MTTTKKEKGTYEVNVNGRTYVVINTKTVWNTYKTNWNVYQCSFEDYKNEKHENEWVTTEATKKDAIEYVNY